MDKTSDSINAMWEELEPPHLKPNTDQEQWEELKEEFYGTNTIASTQWGLIDFSPDAVKSIVGGENLTYDEYLEIMHKSGSGTRPYFENCYYSGTLASFKGEVERRTQSRICFKRIDISGFYGDGTGFSGKEDHVWIDSCGFEDLKSGDCVSFDAEIYRYLKTSNGKAFDFGLRNPYNIQKIDNYILPTDEELRLQAVDELICEVCMVNEHCYMGMCIAEGWRDAMREAMLLLDNNE